MRTRIESVLVPIDESANAYHCVELAKSLEPIQINLFHAVKPWPSYLGESLFPYAGMGGDEVDIQHDVVRVARTVFGRKFEIENEPNISLEIEFGLQDVISESLRTSHADLVIIGAHGANGSRFDAVGDVTGHVVSESKKPVLVVREKAAIVKVLTCVDLSGSSSNVLRIGAIAANGFGADMETMLVIPDAADDVRLLLHSGQTENAKKAIGRARERIDAMFDRSVKEIELGFGEHAELGSKLRKRHIAHGDIVETILHRIQKEDIQLLVVGARHPDSVHLGSHTLALLRRAPINVLVVP